MRDRKEVSPDQRGEEALGVVEERKPQSECHVEGKTKTKTKHLSLIKGGKRKVTPFPGSLLLF